MLPDPVLMYRGERLFPWPAVRTGSQAAGYTLRRRNTSGTRQDFHGVSAAKSMNRRTFIGIAFRER